MNGVSVTLVSSVTLGLTSVLLVLEWDYACFLKHSTCLPLISVMISMIVLTGSALLLHYLVWLLR